MQLLLKSRDSQLEVIEKFPMPQLQGQRNIRIYLPEGYHQTSTRYPVLYMHDGQNLFPPGSVHSGHSWEAGSSLDKLQKEQVTQGVILVGIDCNEEDDGARADEYSPWEFHPEGILNGWGGSRFNRGGKGVGYAQWLTTTLKPFIDTNYRTLTDRQNTMIAGSSLGGYISLYMVLKYSEVFSKAGVFSPAFWFNEAEMTDFVEQVKPEQPVSVYMDMGTLESSDPDVEDFPAVYIGAANHLDLILSKKDSVTDYTYRQIPEAIHSEKDWAQRFPDMMRWLHTCYL